MRLDRLGERIKKLERENASLKKQIKRLKSEAQTDGLTGLKNRFALIPDLLRIIKGEIPNRTRRKIQTFGVLMLDIDWFKEINDCYGHLTGDAVLRRAAQIIKASVKASARRAEDDIYRFGGEEFLVILPFADTAGTSLVGEKIRKNIAHNLIYDFPQIKKDRQSITVSIGGSTLLARKLLPIKGRRRLLDKTVRDADRFLYQAKGLGRNCTVIDGKKI